MRDFLFTPEQIETLRTQRHEHPDVFVRRKFEVLWLKSQAVPHCEIARLADLSLSTVQRHLDEFLERGLEGASERKVHRPASELMDFHGLLEDHFNLHPPATVAQAQADIERLTGLRRGPTQVRKFLKKLSVCPGSSAARSRRKPTSRSSGRFWIRN